MAQIGDSGLGHSEVCPCSNSDQDGSRVTLQLINPDDLPTPSTYTHVVVATGTRMVFIAGQEPEDVHGNLADPGDLAAQGRQVYANPGPST